MIRVEESELSAADVCRIERQIKILEEKVAENHWKRLAIRTCVTIVVAAIVFMASRSWGYTLVPLVVGFVWTSATFDAMSLQKIQRRSLAFAKEQVKSPRKKVITVEDCDYIDFGEIEDEGALYLFSDGSGNWLMLEGQEYYETDTFPSKSFRLSYDSRDALLGIDSDVPFLAPKERRDSSVKRERDLYFLPIGHCIVQAQDEDEAIASIKKLAQAEAQ
jgi:hypothetical protein